MKGYLLVEIEVSDAARYAQYRAATPAVIAAFGGRFIVRGGAVEPLEGGHDGRRVVLIEFPSPEAVRAFWTSPAYAEVKRLREGAAIFNARLLTGAQTEALD